MESLLIRGVVLAFLVASVVACSEDSDTVPGAGGISSTGSAGSGGVGLTGGGGQGGQGAGSTGGGGGSPAVSCSDGTATATYYVATDGSDANDGQSLTAPFQTVGHAASVVVPGDSVYIRGGRYEENVVLDTSGTDSQPIRFEGCPGEEVIIDANEGELIAFSYVVTLNADYNIIANVTLQGASMGMRIFGDHNIGRFLTARYNYGTGIGGYGCHYNVIEDSLAYDNYDEDDGEDADGFAWSGGEPDQVGSNNVFRRCVAYHNVDDGFDCWNSRDDLIEDCVAFENGESTYMQQLTGTSHTGDGNGFKGGHLSDSGTQFRRCVSFNNPSRGFVNNSGGEQEWDNNIAYDNNRGFVTYNLPSQLRNNLNYQGQLTMDDNPVLIANSWQLTVVIDDTDFQSVTPPTPPTTSSSDNPAWQIYATSPFLHLATGSDCIDAGEDIGLPYQGAAPDLGAFESP